MDKMIPVAILGATMTTLSVSPTVIPFHYAKPGIPLLMVDAKVNGQGPFKFILDTGNSAEALIIAPELAEKLHLETKADDHDKRYVVGIDSTMKLTTIDQFDLGDLSASKVRTGVANALSELSRKMGMAVDGNIGYGFLKDYKLTFDYKALTLTLEKSSIVGDALPFSLAKSKPLIIIPVEANGKTLHFALDTGASYTCISNEAAAALGLKLGQELPLNGSGEKGNLTTIPSLKVDGQEQHDVGAVCAGFLSSLSKEAGTTIDGVLGYNFWSKYNLTIDYPNSKLLLQLPNE